VVLFYKIDPRLPQLIDKIRQHCQSDPNLADYIFSTVHKSKGLEWQSVILVSVLHKNFFPSSLAKS
jgi:ATP-dependent exoDNAse (exonuclease V) beta subunit